MPFFPVMLDVSRRACLVVGAGRVAARKAAALCSAGARVRIIAPEAAPAVERMAAAGKLTLVRRRYTRTDLAGCGLVVAATNDPDLNRAVATEAHRRNLPCNTADDPSCGSLLFPATIRRGGLVIAISTEGASPTLARRLKRDLESRIGPEYAALLRLLRGARRHLREAAVSAPLRRRSLKRLAASAALEQLRQGRTAVARRVAERIVADARRREAARGSGPRTAARRKH